MAPARWSATLTFLSSDRRPRYVRKPFPGSLPGNGGLRGLGRRFLTGNERHLSRMKGSLAGLEDHPGDGFSRRPSSEMQEKGLALLSYFLYGKPEPPEVIEETETAVV